MSADTRWWQYLEQQRAGRGMKGPTDFARFLGIPRTKLTTWQQGATPGVDSIKQLAERLGVSVAELLIEAGHFEADDFGLTHLPPDPAALDDDELLDELRRRLAGREPDGPGVDIAPGHVTQRGGPFRAARRGRRAVTDQSASSAPGSSELDEEPANGDAD